ncbi:hypothetical protein LSH36_246g02044 [Paralvinella palmiformis]|uniref:SOCS box domain-containing protein n=1 Tax=Paralvinella palmiformis TaxID=53620 RepID=A0AAD9JM03_9ANNE|nr:hypothetical protein LSH36_246g02044 [Paralvinella palmiformis]
MGHSQSRREILDACSLNKLHPHHYDHNHHHHHIHQLRQCDHNHDHKEAENFHQILSIPQLNGLSKNINKKDKYGMSLLHRACEQGLPRCTELLLHLGADPSLTTCSNHGNTNALILAASGGHSRCLERLLAFGADAQLTDNWGNTALFKAACYDHVDCVELLLEKGADPDVANKWGALPIQYASLEGHRRVVSLLIQAGADVTARGEASAPEAIVGALLKGHYDCFELLLERSVTHLDPIRIQRLLGLLLRQVLSAYDEGRPVHVRMLGLLLKHGAQIDSDMFHSMAKKVACGLDTNVEYSFFQSVLLELSSESTYSELLASLFRTLSRSGAYARRCVDLILNTGYRPKLDDIRHIGTLTLADIQTLKDGLSNPRSLYDSSRLVVRERLEKSIFHKVDELPLPRALKDDVVSISVPLWECCHWALSGHALADVVFRMTQLMTTKKRMDVSILPRRILAGDGQECDSSPIVTDLEVAFLRDLYNESICPSHLG